MICDIAVVDPLTLGTMPMGPFSIRSFSFKVELLSERVALSKISLEQVCLGSK